MDFKLASSFKPTGDQPEAIRQLVDGINDNTRHQTLLGVTGSGKTFTMANVIAETAKPTLVLSHNKTLAAQLYGEFKQFFPENAVEYFVSYYDYYQPEAFLPITNTYIEKDLSINEEIEKLRLSTLTSLLSGRRDIVVVSSVSCIYGLGNPTDFSYNTIRLEKGEKKGRSKILHQFVNALYSRTDLEFNRGNFRVRGDTIDIFPAYADRAYRLIFWGDEIEKIESFNPFKMDQFEELDQITVYPANMFVTSPDTMKAAIFNIQDDLIKQLEFLKMEGKHLEAKRLEERVNYDLEMMRELGYCSGIENYSRYFDGRSAGTRPYCLLDYFPEDYLMFIDESHVTVSQVHAMYGGDRSRKTNLVEYGFRLPAALDNRPLTFDEFEAMQNQVIYVSATPADYELQKSEGVIVEQVIRPTGLLDPVIEIRPSVNQVDDLMEEIRVRVEKSQRVLVTTLTKRMAEELSKYLTSLDINCRYIHSEVSTVERVEILRELRLGSFDVLVGVNLLREGLDLPEVSLVAIMDADKEGFLRSERSLTQTAGRAARHLEGTVIMYADKITQSMQRTIEDTNRKRVKQVDHNEKNKLVPRALVKSRDEIMRQTAVAESRNEENYYVEEEKPSIAADPVIKYMSADQIRTLISKTKRSMEKAAKELDFIEAARLRDEMYELERIAEKAI
ncbi:MAG TPA: excinuclease ABC subunit B [Flavobacteriales bacterium]|nr:excinuclease ABC subunit B [Flavobacteriales bacterium]